MREYGLKVEMIVCFRQFLLKFGNIQLSRSAVSIRQHRCGKSGSLAGLGADCNQTDCVAGTSVTGDNPTRSVNVIDFTAHQATVGNFDAVRFKLLLGAANRIFKVCFPVLFADGVLTHQSTGFALLRHAGNADKAALCLIKGL